jgi:hypothetical protein
VISAAIGGRRTVRGLLHITCNNKAGHTWDAALEKQLRPLALHLGVKRQHGRTSRMAIKTTAGEGFILGSGGTLEMARPDIKRTRTAAGENIRVVAGSFAMARQVLEGKKRKNPHIDVDAVLASAEIRRSYAQGAVQLDLTFGGELSGRSLVKSALALAHDAGIPTDRCGEALNYLRDTNGEPCFGYYYVHDLITDRPTGLPLHCVAIAATPSSGLVLGYVEFFGFHRAVVCLGRGYTGETVKRVYALDPRSGAELQLSVRLAFTEADIKAINNYDRDDAAGRQTAFGNVFGPVLRAHRENERNRVLEEALIYAWKNYGAEPDSSLTEGDCANIRRLFADGATPWLKHVTGYTEEAARREALTFIDLVLTSALQRYASGTPR